MNSEWERPWFEESPEGGQARCRPPHIVRLSDVVPERLDWLWRGRIAFGKVAVIDGDPGLGKSTLTLSLAASLTTGRPMPGEPIACPAAGVVLLGFEDGLADTVQPRLTAHGADLTRVVALVGIPDGDAERLPTIPNDIAAIEHAIADCGARFVIIDPAMAALGPEINSYKDQDVRRAIAPLAAMADRTGVAVLLVRHLTKGQGASALYRGGGSIGIVGAARTGMLVARDPDDDDRRLVAITKSNLAHEAATIAYRLESVVETDVARVVWEGTTSHRADDLVRAPEPNTEGSALDDARAWLEAELEVGPQRAAVLLTTARKDGHSEKTVRRAKDALGVETERTGGLGRDGYWVWRLPVRHDNIEAENPNPVNDSLRSLS